MQYKKHGPDKKFLWAVKRRQDLPGSHPQIFPAVTFHTSSKFSSARSMDDIEVCEEALYPPAFNLTRCRNGCAAMRRLLMAYCP